MFANLLDKATILFAFGSASVLSSANKGVHHHTRVLYLIITANAHWKSILLQLEKSKV